MSILYLLEDHTSLFEYSIIHVLSPKLIGDDTIETPPFLLYTNSLKPFLNVSSTETDAPKDLRASWVVCTKQTLHHS